MIKNVCTYLPVFSNIFICNEVKEIFQKQSHNRHVKQFSLAWEKFPSVELHFINGLWTTEIFFCLEKSFCKFISTSTTSKAEKCLLHAQNAGEREKERGKRIEAFLKCFPGIISRFCYFFFAFAAFKKCFLESPSLYRAPQFCGSNKNIKEAPPALARRCCCRWERNLWETFFPHGETLFSILWVFSPRCVLILLTIQFMSLTFQLFKLCTFAFIFLGSTFSESEYLLYKWYDFPALFNFSRPSLDPLIVNCICNFCKKTFCRWKINGNYWNLLEKARIFDNTFSYIKLKHCRDMWIKICKWFLKNKKTIFLFTIFKNFQLKRMQRNIRKLLVETNIFSEVSSFEAFQVVHQMCADGL